MNSELTYFILFKSSKIFVILIVVILYLLSRCKDPIAYLLFLLLLFCTLFPDAKTRLPSEDSSVESKPKTPPSPSKSPPSQSDDASEGPSSTRQWVRLHYRPGEELKSVSSERLSVQVG